MLQKIERINYLMDFYQDLLTEKQRDILTLYLKEDFSLAEIAEIKKVSRSAIYDNLKRCEKILENYEDKLHLFSKFKKRSIIYDSLLKKGNKDVISLIIDLKEIDNMEE